MKDIEHDGRGWTRKEVAELLGVTPARVSQIATALKIKLRWHYQDGFSYTVRDVNKMHNRNTKPGPNGRKKK